MMGRWSARLRDLAERVLPAKAFHTLAAARSRRWQKRFLQEQGLLDQVKAYVAQHGTVVQAGPFAGLQYPEASALNRWSLPKLTGSYELELHPYLEVFRHRQYDCVIDVGSAEGYYACGLARMLGVPVLAYDPEPLEKAASAQMARLNGVDNLVQMGDLFTPGDMERLAGSRALMVCDCEGFEKVLFTPETLPWTAKWDLLIELHEDAVEKLGSLPWPHTREIVHAKPRSGTADEFRTSGVDFLMCDSQREIGA